MIIISQLPINKLTKRLVYAILCHANYYGLKFILNGTYYLQCPNFWVNHTLQLINKDSWNCEEHLSYHMNTIIIN